MDSFYSAEMRFFDFHLFFFYDILFFTSFIYGEIESCTASL